MIFEAILTRWIYWPCHNYAFEVLAKYFIGRTSFLAVRTKRVILYFFDINIFLFLFLSIIHILNFWWTFCNHDFTSLLIFCFPGLLLKRVNCIIFTRYIFRKRIVPKMVILCQLNEKRMGDWVNFSERVVAWRFEEHNQKVNGQVNEDRNDGNDCSSVHSCDLYLNI